MMPDPDSDLRELIRPPAPRAWIELRGAGEMFVGHFLHADVRQAQAEHRVIKRIVWRELIGLLLVCRGFFESAE